MNRLKELEALISDETDRVANMANISAWLNLVLDNINASFCHMLNSNGLFELKSDADSFSEYLNSHNHCEFENDGKLLPIKVYLKKDNLW